MSECTCKGDGSGTVDELKAIFSIGEHFPFCPEWRPTTVSAAIAHLAEGVAEVRKLEWEYDVGLWQRGGDVGSWPEEAEQAIKDLERAEAWLKDMAPQITVSFAHDLKVWVSDAQKILGGEVG